MMPADAERHQRPAAERPLQRALRRSLRPRPGDGRWTWSETVSSATFPPIPDARCLISTACLRDYTRCCARRCRYAATRPCGLPVRQQIADDRHGCRSGLENRRRCLERDSADRDDRNRPRQPCRGRDEIESDGRVTGVLRRGAEHRPDGQVADRLPKRRLDLRDGVRRDSRRSPSGPSSRRASAGGEIVLAHVHARPLRP